MNAKSKPAPVAPSGEPMCALSEDHWANHWTVADCVMKFENVPPIFRLISPDAVVGNIWSILTLGSKLRLEEAFVLYDIGTGRI